jgi:hypothetical protein
MVLKNLKSIAMSLHLAQHGMDSPSRVIPGVSDPPGIGDFLSAECGTWKGLHLGNRFSRK